MKKLLIPTLCLLLLICAACGAETESLSPVEEDATASDAVIEEASGTNTVIAEASGTDIDAAEPPASMTDTEEYDTTFYETALSYVGCSVEELYDAIGEPNETQYAASCAEENAEDGMLFYDGFYVWSLRTEEDEIVYDVYLDD